MSAWFLCYASIHHAVISSSLYVCSLVPLLCSLCVLIKCRVCVNNDGCTLVICRKLEDRWLARPSPDRPSHCASSCLPRSVVRSSAKAARRLKRFVRSQALRSLSPLRCYPTPPRELLQSLARAMLLRSASITYAASC